MIAFIPDKTGLDFSVSDWMGLARRAGKVYHSKRLNPDGPQMFRVLIRTRKAVGREIVYRRSRYGSVEATVIMGMWLYGTCEAISKARGLRSVSTDVLSAAEAGAEVEDLLSTAKRDGLSNPRAMREIDRITEGMSAVIKRMWLSDVTRERTFRDVTVRGDEDD